MDRKREVRAIIHAVRRVLLGNWDPLAVGGMPGLTAMPASKRRHEFRIWTSLK
jgi:hypothetical protein